MQAVWAHLAPKTALAPPSPEAKRQLTCTTVALDNEYGDPYQNQNQARRGITECFRIDRTGQVVDTQYLLVSRESYGELLLDGAQSVRLRSSHIFAIRPAPVTYYNDGYGRPVPRERCAAVRIQATASTVATRGRNGRRRATATQRSELFLGLPPISERQH